MAFFGLFGRNQRVVSAERPRLSADQWPAAVYAIGDVHGCLGMLRELEQVIVADAAAIEGEKWIVLLGDYVDRGPDPAGVLDHLLARPPAGFKRHTLAGNHEDLMLDYCDAPRPGHDWLKLGGDVTLRSYGIDTTALLKGQLSRRASADLLASYIPEQHFNMLRTMPVSLSLPGTVFVHAGIRRGVAVEDQDERDLVWIRPEPESPEWNPATGPLVVHGHTPAPDPYIAKYRICLDTGAYSSGVMTAARLGSNGLEAMWATTPTPLRQGA